MKKNMVGGPSIIFHRYHEAGKTKIREKEMKDQGKEPKVCEKIIGYDTNALYRWALMQDAPTGSYTRRREETNFKKESSVRMADEWLEWEAKQCNIQIRYRLKDTEKRIGDRQLPVDGFHSPSRTMFQFQGIYCTTPPPNTHIPSTLIILINFVSKFYFQVATGRVITATLLRERFLTKSAKSPWPNCVKRRRRIHNTSVKKALT